jgi:hypothetical protein
MTILRSIGFFVAILLLARFVVPVGGLGWAQSFTNDRIFTVTFGWLDWSQLITWLFPTIVFACLGAVLSLLKVGPKPTLSAILLGMLYSLERWIYSTNHFAPSAGLYLHFWVYGEFFVPPVAAWVGATVAQALARRYNSNGAA